MISFFRRTPTIPVLIINEHLNQERAVNLLKKLSKVSFKNARALAMVVQIQNHMPVQVDKIGHFVQRIKQEYHIPIYGFTTSHVTAESYYLLSLSDKLFTQSDAIFQLKPSAHNWNTKELLKHIGVQKFAIKSNEHLSGANLDDFTSANTSQYINAKMTQLNQRMYEQSMMNRKKGRQQKYTSSLPESVQALPTHFLGADALSLSLADSYGLHYSTLKQLHPDCEQLQIKLQQKISTRQLEFILTSPIIIILFFIKVLIKYTLIMYVWIKARAGVKETSEQ